MPRGSTEQAGVSTHAAAHRSLSFQGSRSERIRGSDKMNINFQSGLQRSSRATDPAIDAICIEGCSGAVAAPYQAVQDSIHLRPLLMPIKPHGI